METITAITRTIKSEAGIVPLDVFVDKSYLIIEMTGFWLHLKLSKSDPSPDDFKAVPKNGYISYRDMQELWELNKISGRIKTLWWHENRNSPKKIIEQAQL